MDYFLNEVTIVDKYTATEMAFKHGYEKGYDKAKSEITHCKDCKYYREGEIFEGIKFCFRLLGSDCKPVGYNFSDDDFCSRGERKSC